MVDTPENFVKVMPLGVTDAFYAYPEGSPTGMAVLADLVPSGSNAAQWVPRPAAIKYLDQAHNFDGSFISAFIVIGTILYGMRASKTFVGFDEPFAYDLIAQAPIPVTGAAYTFPKM